MDETPFAELLVSARRGDASAAEQLIRMYEPEIRRIVRVRLTDSRLRRLVDSVDICQSVLANFFIRSATGQYDLETPEDLLRVLVTMTRNRIIDLARYSNAACRDGRRDVSLSEDEDIQNLVKASGPGPESILINRELIEQFHNRLTEEERRIMQLRIDGESWEQIASSQGQKAAAVRMKLVRAIDRVSEQLGLETSTGQ